MKKLQPMIVSTSATSNGSRYWKTTFNNNNNTIISQNINNDNNNSIAREKAVKIEADLACPPAAPALLLRWKPILK